jgi:CDP-glucose 4,6-dehydratase
LTGEQIGIRNPLAIRPWQHVLEPLSGYLLLARRLVEQGMRFAEAWNFGPKEEDARPVGWIVERLCSLWGEGASYSLDGGDHPHEAHYLKLDCSKARAELGWWPRWSLEEALDRIIEWTLAYRNGESVRQVCERQIAEFECSVRSQM